MRWIIFFSILLVAAAHPQNDVRKQLSQNDETTTDEAVTTEVPTSEVPTTEVPTTQVPTTEVPTTEVPTTEVLTTEVPTTEVPTTEVPTTEVPTTEVPTTEVPTTEVPTTEVPTTEVPTTEVPTTEVPTTEVPTTEVPTTEVPTTEVPTTEVPTTEVPTTEVPTTEVPTTEVPTTEVPTTEVPTTEVPTTEVPTTEVPTTEVPTTEVPTTEVPTTEVPATEVPTTEAITEGTTTEEPDDELPLATTCYTWDCVSPDCRCSSTDTPGGLADRDTPQFVTVTFDGGVNILNIETYRDILYNRQNINGCPAGATFYVNHEYTNYQLVNELYNQGFEIALNSISHRTPQTFWATATKEDLMEEIGDQRIQMSHLANIPYEEIKGVRIPFLQMTGNASFEAMAEVGLTYDASWTTVSSATPGIWPYTLDYASTQDCPSPPCPTASFPGIWVQPMLPWRDLNGNVCAMADGCYNPPPLDDENAWFEFILTNFERHYLSNRAPFGVNIHHAYLSANPAVLQAINRFMNLINNLHDVYMVNSAQVLDWVKNPVPINVYRQQPCRSFTRTSCSTRTCPLTAAHNGLEYWMVTCNVCPRVYPWLGNPLGQ